MRSAALFQFWGVALHPAIDRGVIDVQTSFEHHLLQVAIAQSIPQVPAYAEQNDVGLEMTPFERILLDHDETLLCSTSNKEEFIITPSFLQHNHLVQFQIVVGKKLLIARMTA